MNPAMIENRQQNIATVLNNPGTQKIFNVMIKPKMSKVDAAQKIYQLHKAGGEVGKLCALYGVSSSYYRELKTIKEKEWQIQVLTDDETFQNFINASLKNDVGKNITEENFNETMQLVGLYYCMGSIADTQQDLKDIFDIFNTILKEEEQTESLKRSEKNAAAAPPCQVITIQKNKNFQPDFKKGVN